MTSYICQSPSLIHYTIKERMFLVDGNWEGPNTSFFEEFLTLGHPLGWHCWPSYLASALGSLWFLIVILFAFWAGLKIRNRRKMYFLLSVASALSLTIFMVGTIRGFLSTNNSEYYDRALQILPETVLFQLMVNLLVQIAIPAVIGILIITIKTLLVAGFKAISNRTEAL